MNFLKKLISKIVICPSCSQKLRIPIRIGKTLRIQCNRCQLSFDVIFEHPFGKNFKAWSKNSTFKQNISSQISNLINMPFKIKLLFVLLCVLLLFFIVTLNIETVKSV